MRKFVKKIGIFIFILILTFVAFVGIDVLVIGNQYEGHYLASLQDKMQRLQSIDEPKIVLIGNSNLAFGIDSKMIEEEFGMPVVNMGYYGGLGNAIHESMVKLGVSDGDIVILCHTDYYDYDTILDTKYAWEALETHTEYLPLIRKQDILPLLKAYPGYVVTAAAMKLKGSPGNVSEEGTSFTRSAFNEYGDICLRFDGVSYTFTEESVTLPRVNEICTDRINSINKYVQEQGATMIVAAYPIPDGEYTPPVEEYNAFEKELRNALDCEVISDFSDYFIPYEYFYDGAHHLTEEGAEIRTAQLIEDIRKWQENTQ